MNLTFAIALTVVVVGVAAYGLRRFIGRGRDFNAGVISQSWLTQHRAGKQEDRFS
jgi:hypothetical protein